MAQIDLRNATIQIKDGYVGPSPSTPFEVNNVGGYAANSVTMSIDGGTGALANNDWFTVAGDTVKHRITAHTETTGNTTSITFTPGLGAMVADNADLTILPHEITVKIGDGNLSYTEKRNMKYIKDRGVLSTVRQEDDEPVELKIDAIWEFIKAASPDVPTIEDALKKRGQASGWITSATDTCEPYAVDLVVTYEPPCSGEEDEVITFTDFRYEQFEHDLRQGMFSISGKCNVVEPSVSRV